jgi:hypothetical protein
MRIFPKLPMIVRVINRCDNAAIEQLLQCVDVNVDLDDYEPYDANCFAILLSKLEATSAGPHSIPYWFYKTCSSQSSFVMAKLVSFPFVKSHVPIAWRTAHITHIPKISDARESADFRPISVTPTFATLTEKLVAKDFLLPKIVPQLFSDQYAFKPTCSATRALIDLSYCLQMMLEKC